MSTATTAACSTSLTDQVVQGIHHSGNDRTQHILRRMVYHLHAFIEDVQLTHEEWSTAVDFLTRTGQMCNDRRQEFVLLSDVLGVTMLVDTLQHRTSTADNTSTNSNCHEHPAATETTVEGPFYAPSPALEMGANLAQGPERDRGEPTLVQGTLRNADTGNPIANASIDVWQSDDLGYYDLQQPHSSKDESTAALFRPNLRGSFVTPCNGRYHFHTIKPASYPVPTDGPVGEYLRAAGKNAMRPAHIHFKVEAADYETLVTHIFVKGDPYLDSDAVYAVKDSLIVDFERQPSQDDRNNDITYLVQFDIGLVPKEQR